MIGRPTTRNFRYLLKQNVMQDCPVKSEDVDIAEKIFGRDVATLKGKSTRKRSPIMRSDEIEMPKEILMEHRELELCIDIMFVNELPMLTTIDKTIKYRGLATLPSQHADQIYEAIDHYLRKHQ